MIRLPLPCLGIRLLSRIIPRAGLTDGSSVPCQKDADAPEVTALKTVARRRAAPLFQTAPDLSLPRASGCRSS